MKTKTSVLFLALCTIFQYALGQETQTNLFKIENYEKGDLEIKVVPFGLENPINVGEITADGTIDFNWNTNMTSVKNAEFFMSSIKNAIDMTFCNDKEIAQNNVDAKAVISKELLLYKNEKQVGALLPATDKKMEDNAGLNRHSSLVLGSTISWIYTDEDVIFNAKCNINLEEENVYNFKEVTRYELKLKKGWNIILNTLVEKEDWKNGTESGSLPKTITKTSIDAIPNTMNWYIKYWGE